MKPIYLRFPLSGHQSDWRVTQNFNLNKWHYGIDWTFNKNWDKSVFAAADGCVVYCGYGDVYTDGTKTESSGFTIVITHGKDELGNYIATRYQHLAELPKFKQGDTVKQFQKIGEVGSTGYSTGPHLHFEIIQTKTQLITGYTTERGNVDPGKYDFYKTEEEKPMSKQYEVNTTLQGYNTATDALNHTNPQTAIIPGIYYLYNKYPNGYNGAYNITDDPNKAGSWINPKDNVKEESPYNKIIRLEKEIEVLKLKIKQIQNIVKEG